MLKSIVGSLGKSGILAMRVARTRVDIARALKSPPATATIAMYHDPACPRLQHLLGKLMLYANLPCTLTRYNRKTQSKSNFPMMTLTLNPSTLSSVSPLKFVVHLRTKEELLDADRSFIVDECADMHPHNRHIANSSLSSTTFPVIIDYDNHLLADDDASFDRIMQNYLSCGIQNSMAGPGRPSSTRSINRNLSNHHLGSSLVHPHVAEFADLF